MNITLFDNNSLVPKSMNTTCKHDFVQWMNTTQLTGLGNLWGVVEFVQTHAEDFSTGAENGLLESLHELPVDIARLVLELLVRVLADHLLEDGARLGLHEPHAVLDSQQRAVRVREAVENDCGDIDRVSDRVSDLLRVQVNRNVCSRHHADLPAPAVAAFDAFRRVDLGQNSKVEHQSVSLGLEDPQRTRNGDGECERADAKRNKAGLQLGLLNRSSL